MAIIGTLSEAIVRGALSESAVVGTLAEAQIAVSWSDAILDNISPLCTAIEIGLIDEYTLDCLFDKALKDSVIPDNIDFVVSLYSPYSDWFLPSLTELTKMYQELYLYDLGNFDATRDYWSSSEENATTVSTVNFGAGTENGMIKADYYLKAIRPCRVFTASLGSYSLRDIGPGGGLIFYIDGTTFYEAAPEDSELDIVWSNITDQFIGTTSIAIGEGQNNTNEIINQTGHTNSAAKECDDAEILGLNETNVTARSISGLHLYLTVDRAVAHNETGQAGYIPGTNKLQDTTGNPVVAFTKDIVNNVSIPAPVCESVTVGNNPYSDWFMPSKDLLNQIYVNLYCEGVGNYSLGNYWSSSEYNASYAWLQFFHVPSGGPQSYQVKSNTVHTIPCRSFSDAEGAYALRDKGPAGGFICYIDGTTFYEAALMNESLWGAWSNITNQAVERTSTAIAESQNNTTEIIAQAGHTNSGAKKCDDYTTNNKWVMLFDLDMANIIPMISGFYNAFGILREDTQEYLTILFIHKTGDKEFSIITTEEAVYGVSYTFEYYQPEEDPLQGIAENLVATFTKAVTNSVSGLATAILTELSEYLITENSENIIQE